LNAQDKVLDPDDPESVSADRATLALEAVSFSFENAERPALSHLTFKVSAGESLAIIGGTGSGKSTLVSLMARLMDVTAGVVKFAGLDVRQLPQELLHKEIALTQQKAVLFSGTVSSNLRFGKADATIDEMWAALELAQAADFVRAQGGLEMKVEQDGNNFSGGQRQRLSIARTLIADASVYIFDDSFSALDFVTDGKLRAAIAASPRHRQAIKIIVAQRIATVMTADRILVLEKGLQVGLGSHAELVKSCPQYQDILRSQLSDEDLATMGLPQNS
jgi:ATP-binding cassette subfamily B protein